MKNRYKEERFPKLRQKRNAVQKRIAFAYNYSYNQF